MQTNISPLNPAAVPTEHSRPRILLNVAISVFLGALLGIVVALVLELVNRRVRSAEDLVDVDLPILATIPSAALPSPQGKLPSRFSRRKPSPPMLGVEGP
jgi:capsular polysaccharide biosynthesis protein